MAVHRGWAVASIVVWLVLGIVGPLFVGTSPDALLWWTVVQQGWLVFGGLMALRGTRLFVWNLSEVARGAVAGIGIYVVNGIAAVLTVELAMRWLGADMIVELLELERGSMELLEQIATGRGAWVVLALVALGAPLSEEIFFRGIVLNGLRRRYSPAIALLVSAMLFALVHFYVVQFIPVLISGLLLGLLFLRSGGLVRPLVAHAVVNIMVFITGFV